MYRSAKVYAEKFNLNIFPVHAMINGICSCGKTGCAAAKHPRIAGWQEAATTDSEQVEKWFSHQWPDSNIGLPTGEASGVTVLDVDGEEGMATLQALESQYGELPATPIQMTGGGGYHYIFRYIEGVKNKVSFLPSLDIRNDGGYILLAPSNHVSGGAYEWDIGAHIAEQEIAEAPAWLVDLLQEDESKAKAKPADYWTELLSQPITEGSRNAKTAQLVGHLLRAGINVNVAWELLKCVNEARFDPPEEEEILQRTFQSILRKEVARMKEVNGQYGRRR